MINFLIDSVMMPLLAFFHDLTGSYGWAIVFLTLAVKSALMPLTYQSIKSSLDMQRIQPKLKELQQKYKDKPEVLNKKMMEFYKENKFNPLGGCLPILVQLPVFIALYSTFVSDKFKEMATASGPSFLFIRDLTQSSIFDRATNTAHYDNILLVALFGITMFISQKMMVTNPDDPMQKQMLYMMPVMITVMFFFVPVPSGALLYMVVSNLIGIGQNVFVLNKKKSIAFEMSKAENNPDKTSVAQKAIKEIQLNKNVNLDKTTTIESNDSHNEGLSPVLVSAGKSKRAKKKPKNKKR